MLESPHQLGSGKAGLGYLSDVFRKIGELPQVVVVGHAVVPQGIVHAPGLGDDGGLVRHDLLSLAGIFYLHK